MSAQLQSNCWSPCEGIAERGGGADEPGVLALEGLRLLRLWYSVCSIMHMTSWMTSDDVTGMRIHLLT